MIIKVTQIKYYRKINKANCFEVISSYISILVQTITKFIISRVKIYGIQ